MDYTHIEFLSNNNKVKVLANGSPIVLNNRYPSSTNFTVSKINPEDLGMALGRLTYRAWKNDLKSNESQIVVNLNPNPLVIPSGNTFVINSENDAEINISEHINLNSSTDRIILQGYDMDIGELKLNGIIVNKNETIFRKDLEQLKFYTKKGFGSPYQRISYKAANESQTSSTTNTMSINISGKGSLTLVDSISSDVELYKLKTFNLKLDNTYVKKTATLNLTIDFLNGFTDSGDIIEIEILGKTTSYNQNGVYSIVAECDGSGFIDISISSKIKTTTDPRVITLELVKINSDESLVSTQKLVTMNLLE